MTCEQMGEGVKIYLKFADKEGEGVNRKKLFFFFAYEANWVHCLVTTPNCMATWQSFTDKLHAGVQRTAAKDSSY